MSKKSTSALVDGLIGLVRELDLALRVLDPTHQLWEEDLILLRDAEARSDELREAESN